MRICRALMCVTAVFAFEIVAQAAPFVVFPKAGQLPSPDGRFVVRNTDRKGSPLRICRYLPLFSP
jgi:hypothetical protein